MKHTYDETKRELRLDFQNGHVLRVGNLSRSQADRFVANHAEEFARRDCLLEQPARPFETRGAAPT